LNQELIESKLIFSPYFTNSKDSHSIVHDVESDKLIGKIEGIKESIIYESKTIKDCEQKFREAVLAYKKTKDM
jgi:hypothetical protein